MLRAGGIAIGSGALVGRSSVEAEREAIIHSAEYQQAYTGFLAAWEDWSPYVAGDTPVPVKPDGYEENPTKKDGESDEDFAARKQACEAYRKYTQIKTDYEKAYAKYAQERAAIAATLENAGTAKPINGVAIGTSATVEVQSGVALGAHSLVDATIDLPGNVSNLTGYDALTGTNYAGADKDSGTWKSVYGSVSVGRNGVADIERGEDGYFIVVGNNGTVYEAYSDSSGTNRYTEADLAAEKRVWVKSQLQQDIYIDVTDSIKVTRRISNVAAGVYDTDAVNVAQLKRAAVLGSDNRIVAINPDGNVVTSPYLHIKGVEADAAQSVYALAYGGKAIAMGETAEAFGELSTAIGVSANATGRSSIAIGTHAHAYGNHSGSIGMSGNDGGTDENRVSGSYSFAIGIDNHVGLSSSSTGWNGQPVYASDSSTRHVYVFGEDNTISEYGNSVRLNVFGENNEVGFAKRSTIIGNDNQVGDRTAGQSQADKPVRSLVVIGNGADIGAGARSTVAIGNEIVANGPRSVALGETSVMLGEKSVAMGFGAFVGDSSLKDQYDAMITARNGYIEASDAFDKVERDYAKLLTARDLAEAELQSYQIHYDDLDNAVTRAQKVYDAAEEADTAAAENLSALETRVSNLQTQYDNETNSAKQLAISSDWQTAVYNRQVAQAAKNATEKNMADAQTALNAATDARTAFANGEYKTAKEKRDAKQDAVNDFIKAGGDYAAKSADAAEKKAAYQRAEEALISGTGSVNLKGAVAIGNQAIVLSNDSIAIGSGDVVLGANSIAVGTGLRVSGSNSGAFGDPSVISADSSYSVGNNNTLATGLTDVFALGNSIQVTDADASGSVFLGTGASFTVAGDATAAKGAVNSATVGGMTYSGFAAGDGIAGVVAVNSGDYTRRIQGVAPGLIGKDSTDAINGSQLYAAYTGLQWRVSVTSADSGAVVNPIATTARQTVGSYDNSPNLGNVDLVAGSGIRITATSGDALSLKFEALDWTASDGTGNETQVISNGGITISGDNGVTVTNNNGVFTISVDGTGAANGSTVYAGDFGGSVALSLDQTLNVKGNAADETALTDGNIGVVADSGNNQLTIKLNKNVNLGDDGLLTIGDTTISSGDIRLGDTITINHEGGITIAGAPSGDVIINGDTFNVGGNVIHNVAAGSDDTDAVNMSQLREVAQNAGGTWELAAGENADSESATVKGGDTVKFIVGDQPDGSDNLFIERDRTEARTVKFTIKENPVFAGQVTATGGFNANYKKIVNVAKGEVSKTSTEAVNGSQLHETAQSVANTFGGSTTVNNGNVVGFNVTMKADANNTGGTTKNYTTVYDALKAADDTMYNMTQHFTTKRLTVEGDVDVGTKGGTFTSHGPAVFKDTALFEKPVTMKDGLSMSGTKITDLADGEADTDAVNVRQLKAMGSSIGDVYNKLDNNIRGVGSRSAALAALHPLDYDPDKPTSFMAGVGFYRGESSAAVGLSHHFNDDTLLTAGTTVGHQPMVNLGLSLRLGRNTNMTEKRWKVQRSTAVNYDARLKIMEQRYKDLKLDKDAEISSLKQGMEFMRQDNGALRKDNDELRKRLKALEDKFSRSGRR